MIKATIVGATGFTGSELVRLLINHPEVSLSAITSESHKGKRFSQIHPQFEGICDMELRSAQDIDQWDTDLCFLALPHRVSMAYVKQWRDKSFNIIDLSGDYRLSSADVYTRWYDKEHDTPELVSQVPYGLPELYRERLQGARLIANPGCFPTASLLALAPLLKKKGLVDPSGIIIDAKTGLTGAGVKSSPVTHFSNVHDNFKAYGLKFHRHTIEIEEVLGQTSNSKVTVQFTPHLLPTDRGILVTAYLRPLKPVNQDDLNDIFHTFYKDEPFIRLRRHAPDLKGVRGTNLCDIFVTFDDRTGNIIVVSVLDNLVKGAAGLAIQNMNVMYKIEETSGLFTIPLQP